MFEKLFVKTSDLVFHKTTPYAVERESFPAQHVKRAHTPQILSSAITRLDKRPSVSVVSV
jgi:hypothetical protein